jgi:hypothetical protein
MEVKEWLSGRWAVFGETQVAAVLELVRLIGIYH